MNSNNRTAVTLYSLGTQFVSGIQVQIPCIKDMMVMVMMMMMIIIIIIIIIIITILWSTTQSSLAISYELFGADCCLRIGLS